MCAILDANTGSEVFGSSPSPAGQKFLQWVNKGQGRLVVGGKLLSELKKLSAFEQWAQTAIVSGRMRTGKEEYVATITQQLEGQGDYLSDDPHILALAQVSGARLLYSNDSKLQKDFKSKSLIDNPRGKVYTTNAGKGFSRAHQGMLGRKDLCKRGE